MRKITLMATSISHFIWTMVKIKLGYIYFLKKKKKVKQVILGDVIVYFASLSLSSLL